MKNILALAREAIQGNTQAIDEFNDLLEENDLPKTDKFTAYCFVLEDFNLSSGELDRTKQQRTFNSQESLDAFIYGFDTLSHAVNYQNYVTYISSDYNDFIYALYRAAISATCGVWTDDDTNENLHNFLLPRQEDAEMIQSFNNWLHLNLSDKNYVESFCIAEITFYKKAQ